MSEMKFSFTFAENLEGVTVDAWEQEENYEKIIEEKKFQTAEFAKKNLFRWLKKYSFFDICRMVWQIDTIQSTPPNKNTIFQNFPSEAATSQLGSKWIFLKWYLEDLIAAKLLTMALAENDLAITAPREKYDFWEFAKIYNKYYDYCEKDIDRNLNSERFHIELHRIPHQQFLWQRGTYNLRDFYRNLRIYRNEDTKIYFRNKYGHELDDYLNCCLFIWVLLRIHGWIKLPIDLSHVGISSASLIEFTLSKLAQTVDEGCAFSNQHTGDQQSLRLVPSPMRDKPVVVFNSCLEKSIIAPLPDLVFSKISSGLFYEFVSEAPLRTTFGTAFEIYFAELFDRANSTFCAEQEYVYKVGRDEYRSPDATIKLGGEVKFVAELKATRIPYNAQFSDDPTKSAKGAYQEVAKGITQLWRYLQHSHGGHTNANYAEISKVPLIVVSLSDWKSMSGEINRQIITLAHKLADEKKIEQKFRNEVLLTSVSEIESLLTKADNSSFLETLILSQTEKYKGWDLFQVFREKIPNAKSNHLFSDLDICSELEFWPFSRDHPRYF